MSRIEAVDRGIERTLAHGGAPMAATGWLLSAASELPPGREWLSRREREALSGLRYEKRRRDWLLGRWTAKSALAAWLDAPLGELEVIAAGDDVPEPFRRGEPAPAALSISHCGGRALAAVAQREAAVGCDLELVERRSPAFLREWLAPAERELVGRAAPGDDVLLANLVWCAKEAAAKARRGGLGAERAAHERVAGRGRGRTAGGARRPLAGGRGRDERLVARGPRLGDVGGERAASGPPAPL